MHSSLPLRAPGTTPSLALSRPVERIPSSPQDDHQHAGQRRVEPGADDMLSKSKTKAWRSIEFAFAMEHGIDR